ADAALDFAKAVLSPEGAFVAKVWQGGSEKELLTRLKRRFAKVRHIKPAASRSESAEPFVVATGFREDKEDSGGSPHRKRRRGSRAIIMTGMRGFSPDFA